MLSIITPVGSYLSYSRCTVSFARFLLVHMPETSSDPVLKLYTQERPA